MKINQENNIKNEIHRKINILIQSSPKMMHMSLVKLQKDRYPMLIWGYQKFQFSIPQEEESENYFSTSEDEVINIEPEGEENSENSRIEEIFGNKNVEDTFNEQNFRINKKQQMKPGKRRKLW